MRPPSSSAIDSRPSEHNREGRDVASLRNDDGSRREVVSNAECDEPDLTRLEAIYDKSADHNDGLCHHRARKPNALQDLNGWDEPRWGRIHLHYSVVRRSLRINLLSAWSLDGTSEAGILWERVKLTWEKRNS